MGRVADAEDNPYCSLGSANTPAIALVVALLQTRAQGESFQDNRHARRQGKRPGLSRSQGAGIYRRACGALGNHKEDALQRGHPQGLTYPEGAEPCWAPQAPHNRSFLQ